MGNLDKLKSRSEWQAFLLTALTIFLNHFLGWEMSAESLMALVGSSSAYGISRGMAKGSSDPDASGGGAAQTGTAGGDGG